MRPLYLALALILGLLLLPFSAHAETKKMQVLSVLSADAFENASALTVALKRAVTRADGWTLAPGDFSLEVLMAGFNCEEEPDDECLTKIAGSVESDRFIWGVMKKVDDEVVAELHLWEGGKDAGHTTLRYSVNLADASDDILLQMAEDAFNELLGVSEGKLVVLAGDATGEVYVNGQKRGEIVDGKAELKVPAGDVEIVIRAEGYLEAKSTAKLRPGGKTKVFIDVIPDPDYVEPKVKKEKKPREPHRAHEPEEDRKSRKPVSAQKMVGFGALAAGLVVAGVGTGYWVSSYSQRNDQTYEDYRATVDEDEDPCEQAKVDQREDIIDHCEANRSTRTMARILTPAGGVVVVAGLVLVLTDKPAQRRAQRKLQPAVAIGPRGGRVNLNVRF